MEKAKNRLNAEMEDLMIEVWKVNEWPIVRLILHYSLFNYGEPGIKGERYFWRIGKRYFAVITS